MKHIRKILLSLAIVLGFAGATQLPASATITSYTVKSCVSGWAFKVTWNENTSNRTVTSYGPGGVYQASSTGTGTWWYFSNTYPAFAYETNSSTGAVTQVKYPTDQTGTIVNC